jgi:hypothetical protein
MSPHIARVRPARSVQCLPLPSTVLTADIPGISPALAVPYAWCSRSASSFVATPPVAAKSLQSGCADAHSSPLLEESNTIEASMVKALSYLEGKPKGDISMEGKRSARKHSLSRGCANKAAYGQPWIGQTSGDSLQVNNQRVMVLLPLPEITRISRSSP